MKLSLSIFGFAIFKILFWQHTNITATPGRILDLAKRNCANLSQCSMVALDEADKLLSVDFVEIIEEILNYLKREH